MSTTNTFKDFITELRTLEERIKSLQDEADAIKDIIKEEMTTSGQEEIITDDFKIVYRDVISNRFDSTTFKKTYAELYKQFTKSTTYKRLTIN